MAPALLWFTTFAFGAAIGLGVLTLGVSLLIALVPVAFLIAASSARRIGISGLSTALGLTWFGSFLLARDTCPPDARGGQPSCGSGVEQAFLSAALVLIGIGIGLLLIRIRLSRPVSRRPGRDRE